MEPARWRRKAAGVCRTLRLAVDVLRLRAGHLRARWYGRSPAPQSPRSPYAAWLAQAVPYPPITRPPEFSSVAQPHVSIVVPVYNHLEHTVRCLHSLADAGACCTFEVIVVDDGSSDGSAQWVGSCSHVRLHRMPSNAGYVAACNAGAALARGQYLVFLNNDTEVRAGWLDALIGTFQTDPRCGLAGAKLIYPDGRLQEAGGIVFADGNACNYGRNHDPCDTRYDFVREVDYCSGACIAISKALFFDVGGYDPRYAPAYYEDTDLAFEVRAAGYKVIYQPRAEVFHWEGATAGEDPGHGVKRFQQINREKFVQKQQRALAKQPSPLSFAASPERCATHQRGRHVLVIDADFPHADRDSGSLRMHSMLLLLRELGCHVLFWANAAMQRDGYSDMLERQGIELVLAPSRTEALQWWYRRGNSIDIVLMSRLPVALHAWRWVRRYADRATVIFDTVDLHFLRIARGAALHGSSLEAEWADELRAAELRLVRETHMTLVVSDYERTLLHELVPKAEVRILSNVHPVLGRSGAYGARSGMLFLGNFQHAPNVDAVDWLVREIMPLLRTKLPGIVLHVVGYAGGMALAGRECADVVVHDYVADLEPMLGRVKLALAPLRYGAGVKGKINMAMSHGLPVVTTAVGAEGMGLVDRRDALIADDADAFADAIAGVYDDEKLWTDLSDQGLENVRLRFSPATARGALEQIVSATRPIEW